MTCMLCRNRVSDFRRWRRVFFSHAPAHRAAGLHLRSLWREIGKPNEVFFLFEVKNRGKAAAFIASPDAPKWAALSGLIEGDYHFIRESGWAAYRKSG